MADGVALYQGIDSYAEGHPAFRRSRTRVSRERRHYVGIMVDLFYNHFLAQHWADYDRQPLESFSADIYALLRAHEALLLHRFARIPFIQTEDWLSPHWAPEAVGTALDRMVERRFARPNSLARSAAELTTAYGEFEKDFLTFFPNALALAEVARLNRAEER